MIYVSFRFVVVTIIVDAVIIEDFVDVVIVVVSAVVVIVVIFSYVRVIERERERERERASIRILQSTGKLQTILLL